MMVFLADSPGIFLRTRIHSSEILVSVMNNKVGCFGVAVAVLKLSVCLLFVIFLLVDQDRNPWFSLYVMGGMPILFH